MGICTPMTSFTRCRHVRWFGIMGILVVLVTSMARPLDGLRNVRAISAPPSVIAPKILTVTMFQTGDPLAGGSGEASVWVKNDTLNRVVQVPGSFSPLYCNASFEHCLVITGVLAANAATTVMAVGLSERIDLSRSYIMVAGVGGGPPDKITVGAAAWADWVVSGDLVTELDAREMPPDWAVPKSLPRLRPAMVPGRLPYRHRSLSAGSHDDRLGLPPLQRRATRG